MLTKQNPESKESYLTEILYLQAQRNVEVLNYELTEAEINQNFDRVFEVGAMLEEAHKQAYNLHLQLI